MRKLKFLSILILAVTFIISCTKEGPEGPIGATGPQGPIGGTGATGPQGPTGTANVIYSAWYVTTAADWAANVAGPPYWEVFNYNRSAPGVTQSIIDNGVVLSFMKNWAYDDGTGTALRSGTTVQLPYLADINYMDYYDFVLPAVGTIKYLYKSQGPWVQSVMTGTTYRYVIIPGGVSGGRGVNSEKIANVDGQTYTESQLKAMSYSQICDLLKIAP